VLPSMNSAAAFLMTVQLSIMLRCIEVLIRAPRTLPTIPALATISGIKAISVGVRDRASIFM